MKRNYFTSAMMFITMLCSIFTLTSCDEENREANRLNGEWEGDFGMYYEYRHSGRTYRFDSFDSYLQLNNGLFSDHGTGVQIDFYDYGPYREVWHDIVWRVNRDTYGNLYLSFHYRGESEWDTDIYRYRLNSYQFSGYFGDSDNRFILHRLTPPEGFSWEPYYAQDYGYYYNSGWSNSYFDRYPYYAPSKNSKTKTEADATATDPECYVPAYSELTFGNRYVDAEKAAKAK